MLKKNLRKEDVVREPRGDKMKILIMISLLFLYSCSHSVHLVHLDGHEVPASKRGKLVMSEAEQTVIMGFKFDTNYVNQARRELLSKCPNGHIKKLMTRSSTSHGFFHWKNKILMQGTCY